jgi:hypothetical protein
MTSLYQDFYATIFISNIVAITKMSSDETIAEDNMGKRLKYKYKTNESVLINKLKDRFILALIANSKRKSDKVINKIIKQ